MLDRDQVRKAIRGPIATVNVPEWGGEVGIRRLSAWDLIRLREVSEQAKPAEGDAADGDEKLDDAEANLIATCELLAMGLCDGEGKPLFTADELREWDGQQIDLLRQLIGEVQKHNGLGGEAAEALLKNSESGQISGST